MQVVAVAEQSARRPGSVATMGTLSADLGFKYPPFREGANLLRSIRSSSAARPIEISVAVDACRTRSVSPSTRSPKPRPEAA